MGIRESIEKHKAITTGLAILVIASAAALTVHSAWPTRQGLPTRAFFTTDDGKTWFAAGIENLPPFQHEGKTAYRVVVMTCDGGKTTFAAYLERYTPEARRKLEASQSDALKAGKQMPTLALYAADIVMGGTEVKKPGEGNPWVNRGDGPRASRIVSVDGPNGAVPDSVAP